MNKVKSPVILWFRLDLRIADNPALVKAIESGKPVIPVYILAQNEEGNWSPGAASRWWLHYSLSALSKSLEEKGLELLLFSGKSKEILEKLVKVTGADTIFWNRRYEPSIVERDTGIKEELSAKDIKIKSFNSSLLFEPWEVSTKQDKPYQVFTPFWKTCMSLASPRGPLEPAKLTSSAKWKSDSDLKKLPVLKLQDLNLLPEIKWDTGLKEGWQPGEANAIKTLERFLDETILNYQDSRNIPSVRGVSYMSPYLHYGEISPHQIWSRVENMRSGIDDKDEKESIQTYLKELGWREFAHHVLFNFPKTANEPLREQFNSFKWIRDTKNLEAWQKGLTGYPIVDAGMRELWHTGWMHNRVRMIVASFLTKDLLISWKQGAEWFWDTLVDADLANNTLGWQWAGGCGADAAPYFRIFNPITQGERFDPDGRYVRKWIPEIAGLPNKWLHKPFEAPGAVLRASNIVLGETYPGAIVEHSVARKRALAALADSK